MTNIEQFTRLVALCIGKRTLRQASDDTKDAIVDMKMNNQLKQVDIDKISVNMLSRLKSGDIKRDPNPEYLKILTHEKANPQNDITFSDFGKILDQNTIKSQNKKKKSDDQDTTAAIINWILEQNQETKIKKCNANGVCNYPISIYAEMNDTKYLFGICDKNFLAARSYTHSKLEHIIFWLATCQTTADILIIATSNKPIAEKLKDIAPLNIKTRTQVWYIDENLKLVSDIANLS